MTRSDKQAIIESVWIVRNSEAFPRLVTGYVISSDSYIYEVQNIELTASEDR